MSERPSAIEFIKSANLEKRNKENQVRVDKITQILVENSGIFGGEIEEEKSQQVSQEVLGVFGAGYSSVEKMSNTLINPSATDTQKNLAKENLNVLGKGIFVAMNKSFANYSTEATETITSQLTGEQIDDILPSELKGAGKYVAEIDKNATDEEKKRAKEPFKKEGRVDKKNDDNKEKENKSYSQVKEDEESREETDFTLDQELSGLEKKNNVRKSYSESRELDIINELTKGGVEGIYEKIEYIEKGTSNVDDLSRNSDYFRFIYMVSNGRFDDILRELSFEGKKLGIDGAETLKKEIDMRMFLHNFYLAASKCHSIEDIVRVVGSMHEGDLDHSLDREFLRFFLEGKGGMGLQKLPVYMAWNLRQKGYFQIDEIKKNISGVDKKAFLDYLNNSTQDNDVVRRRIGLDKVEEYHIAESTGLHGKNIEIHEDRDYGIDKDVYKNFYQIEGGVGIDYKIIKEYMIWKMKQDSGCSDKQAVKAFELAQKLSKATFADSKANIAFASDDYSEMILFKYFRYTDSIGQSKSGERKSKSVGSVYNIRHVDTLVCHWLDVSRKDNVDIRSIYSPLFSHQIDFNKIVGNSDMAYHFSSIVASQVEPVKAFFTDKTTPKDILGNLNKIYAKINKATSELCKAGIKSVYFSDAKKNAEVYSREKVGSNNLSSLAERTVREKMRKVWLFNLFNIMGNNQSGWTSLDTENLIKSLLSNEQIIQDNKMPGGSFLPYQDIYELIKLSKVERRVRDNDIEIKMSKARNVY